MPTKVTKKIKDKSSPGGEREVTISVPTTEERAEQQRQGQRFIQEREKLAAQLMEQGVTPRLAQERASAGVTAREQGLTTRQISLEESKKAAALREEQEQRQVQEREELIPSIEAPTSQFERSAAAGIAVLDAPIRALGLSKFQAGKGLVSAEEKAALSPAPVKAAAATIGFLTTSLNIGGISVAKLFSNQDKNIAELDGDTRNIMRQSGIEAQSVKNGGDVDVALANIRRLEDVARNKFVIAQQELKKNPSALAAGLDLTEEMNYRLSVIQSRRQALENFKLTGNITNLDLSLGTLSQQELNISEIT